MRILSLPLKKEWYNMIESGIKTEEYREIKQYWIKRLCNALIVMGCSCAVCVSHHANTPTSVSATATLSALCCERSKASALGMASLNGVRQPTRKYLSSNSRNKIN